MNESRKNREKSPFGYITWHGLKFIFVLSVLWSIVILSHIAIMYINFYSWEEPLQKMHVVLCVLCKCSHYYRFILRVRCEWSENTEKRNENVSRLINSIARIFHSITSRQKQMNTSKRFIHSINHPPAHVPTAAANCFSFQKERSASLIIIIIIESAREFCYTQYQTQNYI